ncbi:heme oxygenase 1 isoform X2 [Bemisia tabaci]|uniref:heme oxygenase 1 isoform X2 n=1 Tax=Bemisia tabaci TaxID=7038 RepID=UPI0008F99DB1|nr:PREDICTED: heme oxygenase 1 isoform X2 [Bemisia tabaci]XP_018899778.1 PREDICTED: heme oxygenase 1 isoform X2 [Bemisia tabaci]XP_018899780.1 PREDICTED: heme oxygenase 1 isoform X2 [Bemisia tabaci]XP_018899781.1 PREDICTED: heme oxygenase 1 isoform X2 [Bemisia tabaci]
MFMQSVMLSSMQNYFSVGTLSNNAVWADGLLVFYEVFRLLENAMTTLKGSSVHQFNIEGLARTEAFELDLAYYLGVDWTKTYEPRESVVKYLMHLRHLEKTEPILLVAYIYHLYMGLLSGGQILRKKRIMASKLNFFTKTNGSNPIKGYSVTDFGRHSLYQLKQKLRATLDELALTLDDETKLKLLEESRRVFLLNNEIIKSVRGTTTVVLLKLLFILVVVVILYFCYLLCKNIA